MAGEWASNRAIRREGERAVLSGRDGERGADDQLLAPSFLAHLTGAPPHHNMDSM